MGKVLIKRKHTDKHPAIYRTSNGKLRNEILAKIYAYDGHKMPLDDYHKHCDSLRHRHKLSYSPKNWYKRFPTYVRLVKPNGVPHLKLTRVGKNLVKYVINGR